MPSGSVSTGLVQEPAMRRRPMFRYDTWEELEDAQRRQPDPDRPGNFIEVQLDKKLPDRILPSAREGSAAHLRRVTPRSIDAGTLRQLGPSHIPRRPQGLR